MEASYVEILFSGVGFLLGGFSGYALCNLLRRKQVDSPLLPPKEHDTVGVVMAREHEYQVVLDGVILIDTHNVRKAKRIRSANPGSELYKDGVNRH